MVCGTRHAVYRSSPFASVSSLPALSSAVTSSFKFCHFKSISRLARGRENRRGKIRVKKQECLLKAASFHFLSPQPSLVISSFLRKPIRARDDLEKKRAEDGALLSARSARAAYVNSRADGRRRRRTRKRKVARLDLQLRASFRTRALLHCSGSAKAALMTVLLRGTSA